MSVIANVGLSVEPGEIAVLLGSNGAGKTTTLLTISGLLDAISGDVRLDASRSSEAGPRRSPGRADPCPRRPLAVPHADRGREHPHGREIQVGRRTRPRLLPVLKPLLARSASVLSGGEQQMLALARGLAARPRVLLVDEMSLGLAPMIVQRILPAS